MSVITPSGAISARLPTMTKATHSLNTLARPDLDGTILFPRFFDNRFFVTGLPTLLVDQLRTLQSEVKNAVALARKCRWRPIENEGSEVALLQVCPVSRAGAANAPSALCRRTRGGAQVLLKPIALSSQVFATVEVARGGDDS